MPKNGTYARSSMHLHDFRAHIDIVTHKQRKIFGLHSDRCFKLLFNTSNVLNYEVCVLVQKCWCRYGLYNVTTAVIDPVRLTNDKISGKCERKRVLRQDKSFCLHTWCCDQFQVNLVSGSSGRKDQLRIQSVTVHQMMAARRYLWRQPIVL